MFWTVVQPSPGVGRICVPVGAMVGSDSVETTQPGLFGTNETMRSATSNSGFGVEGAVVVHVSNTVGSAVVGLALRSLAAGSTAGVPAPMPTMALRSYDEPWLLTRLSIRTSTRPEL